MHLPSGCGLKNSLGYEVLGHTPFCDCGRRGEIDERYDLYACVACDKWLEAACGDECINCPFPRAPERPSECST